MTYPQAILDMYAELQHEENTDNYDPNRCEVMYDMIQTEIDIYHAESGADRELGFDSDKAWDVLDAQYMKDLHQYY